MRVYPSTQLNEPCLFKSKTLNSDFQRNIEKRAYIDSKTESLENGALLAFLGAFGSGIYNINSTEKNHKSGKLCMGLIITSILLLTAKWFRQIQLSKQYDKGV